MGFPNTADTFVEGPITRTIIHRGIILGFPYFGRLPYYEDDEEILGVHLRIAQVFLEKLTHAQKIMPWVDWSRKPSLASLQRII